MDCVPPEVLEVVMNCECLVCSYESHTFNASLSYAALGIHLYLLHRGMRCIPHSGPERVELGQVGPINPLGSKQGRDLGCEGATNWKQAQLNRNRRDLYKA